MKCNVMSMQKRKHTKFKGDKIPGRYMFACIVKLCLLLIVVLLLVYTVRLNGESRVSLKRVVNNDNIQRRVAHLINFLLFLYALLSIFYMHEQDSIAMLNLCRIPLLLCLGSYIILSRNIDAMQLMKGFYKKLSDYSGLCSWLSSPRMNLYSTQGCEHGDFYLRVHIH